ncbi:peptidoglycan editing factor PgeF [Leptolyngbya sp. 7M]|uniref:peptidoglycan editing factor PgeF n=1 Tax=Leptolyngbya sp. 7M TaxID=2812896 RepID=UPI001B8C68D3|nr:peptidoglycan editing factor PgeF [Leptolyngbya sp. 7M]QYO65416.1 peptidoglycan editing factor PgeF [Leptolyngbya sp. 7M]
MDRIITSNSSVDDETLAESGFYWRDEAGLRALICEPLKEAGFINAFSTRLGGVSNLNNLEDGRQAGFGTDLNLAGFDDDLAENIFENRRRFMNLFPGDLKLSTVWQVHGTDIKIIRNEVDADETETRSDAIISQVKNLLVGVKTADCVPVLIGDERTGSYAAVHAGWRGTVGGIVTLTIDRMMQEFDTDPNDIWAAIGPAACGRNYEVGQEVIDAFSSAFEAADHLFKQTRPGHAFIDLHQANREQLTSRGVPPAQIFTAPFCTMERSDLFFSYRIEKQKFGRTGRLLSVIGSV